MRFYYKSLYPTKLENLDEMDDLLDRNQETKLKQDQVKHLNMPLSPKDIETIIKNLPSKESLGADGFSAEIYQTFKAYLIQYFSHYS